MFDLLIEVIDFDALKKCGYKIVNNKFQFSETCLKNSSKIKTMETLNSNSYANLECKFNNAKDAECFIIKIMSKNITTIQYSMIFYDENTKKFIHVFKLFEVTRDSNNYILLTESKINRSEEEWQAKFPYKKDIIIID